MQRLSIILLAAALCLSLTFLSAPTATADDRLTIRYAATGPPKGTRAEALKWWAEEIEKRSLGKVRIKFFWGGALLKARDVVAGVGTRTADAGDGYGVYHPDKNPLWTVADTPFSHDDVYAGIMAMHTMFKTYQPMRDELAGLNIKLLMPWATGLGQLGASKKEVRTPEDVKGLKIRYAGGLWAKLWKECGAVPIRLSQGDVYEAMQRGTADATQSYFFILEAYKHWDVLKYYTVYDAGQLMSYGLVINKDLWENLPPDIKLVISDVSDETAVLYARYLIESPAEVKPKAEEKGVSFIRLTDEEKAKWMAKAQPFMEDWVKDMESKGLPGKETQDLFLNTVADFKARVAENGYPWEKK